MLNDMINNPSKYIYFDGAQYTTSDEGNAIIRLEAFQRASQTTDLLSEDDFQKLVETQYQQLQDRWTDVAVNFLGG